jgi:protein arginine kinase
LCVFENMNNLSSHSPLHVLSPVPPWATAGGDESAVVLTTRVRVARNLKGELFPPRMDAENRIRLLRQLAQVIAHLAEAEAGVFLSLSALTSQEIAVLVERRTISPQLARDEKPRAVFAWKEQDRAVMLCEEDHLHLTDIVPGLAPKQAWENLQPTLAQLSSQLEFASDDALGFLTACPANVGAAVRTSLFCHLPGLVMTGGMENLASHCADAGFTIRGFWGEGSEVLGNTFQLTDGPGLSHQVSDMLSRIESLGQEVIEREAIARIDLQTQRPILIKDRIVRALAILQVCRALSGAETLALFSAMRLGIDIGYIEGLSRATISSLTYELGKAYLKFTNIEEPAPDWRQIRRADRVREVFAAAHFVD